MIGSRLLVALWLAFSAAGVFAAADNTLRPEVGKPLQAAQDLLKAGKAKDALAKVREADGAVKDLTPYERYILDRMRGAAAASAGDTETATKSFDAALASSLATSGEKQALLSASAGMHYKLKDYAKSAEIAARFFQEGGKDPGLRQLYVQSLYLSGNYAQAAKELTSDLQADDQAGKAPAEDRLLLLVSCYSKQQDNAGYALALERLLAVYPKRDYWIDAIYRSANRPGFSDRLSLDVARLKIATGTIRTAGEYMEAAQLSVQSGFPAEAQKIVEQAYSAGLFGSGADADRQKRLRTMVAKGVADDAKTLAQSEAEANSAKDGTALVNLGLNYVFMGKAEHGLELMEKGVKKGGMKRPEDAKLHLGVAYALAGEKQKATQVLKGVQGNDGTGSLARLWVLHLSQSK